MNYIPDTTETTVRMGTIEVQGLSLFYREAGKSSDPKGASINNLYIAS